jgi:hypothetical protein
MAFPHKGIWYLIEHDRLVSKAGKTTDWLKSSSWLKEHGYSSRSINRNLLETLDQHKLGPVYGAVLDDD